MDLDFVNVAFAKRTAIRSAMEQMGFREQNRYFRHPETEMLVEFPPGPLGVGEEPVKQIDEITTPTGAVRIISPTDCVKDRLAWYYHSKLLMFPPFCPLGQAPSFVSLPLRRLTNTCHAATCAVTGTTSPTDEFFTQRVMLCNDIT